MRIVPLAKGVLLLTQVGNSDAVTLASFEELTAEMRRSGSLTVFADARWTKRMSPELRDTAVKWATEHRSSLRQTTVLVGSKLMDMALSVLAMLVGGGLVKSVSELSEFERRIRVHAPSFSGLPELEAPPLAPSPDAANRTP
jgi:hypothetical protein